MFNQLTALGQLDEANPLAVSQCLNACQQLLLRFRQHQQHEDLFIQPQLPIFSQSEQDHYKHEQEILDLASQIEQIKTMPAVISANALHELYQQLSLFCSGQLQHMHTEETQMMEYLWKNHTDEQLQSIHDQLVHSLSAEERQNSFRLILPALTETERLGLVMTLQKKLPEPAFCALLSDVQHDLNATQQRKLNKYLKTNLNTVCSL
jgi:hypothetical protein